MTQNEIIETLCYAIAHKDERRAVVEYDNEELEETLLIDFSNEGAPFGDGIVCMWSLQREIPHAEGNLYQGTEELDSGTFMSYAELFTFVQDTLAGKDGTIHAESF